MIATRQAAADPAAGLDRAQIGLIVCAAILIGIAGIRTAKGGFSLGFTTVCAIWASIVACLMGVAAVLGETYRAREWGNRAIHGRTTRGWPSAPQPCSPWCIPSIRFQVFLLIGPVIGSIAGAIFASFGKPKKV